MKPEGLKSDWAAHLRNSSEKPVESLAEPVPARGRVGALVLVALAETLAISVWLISSAIHDDLRQSLDLQAWQSTALTTIVQLGFVLGTLLAAVLNLADLISNRAYFSIAAILTGLVNALLLVCDNFWSALAVRLAVGMLLAGVYPPAMKMVATWFRQGRGFAIGTVVGALTLGKALPFLIKALHWSDWRAIVVLSSAGAVLAGVLVLFLYRDGPFSFERRAFSLNLIQSVVRHRLTRLAIGGYLGHMWELYAMWTSIGFFLAAAASRFRIALPWFDSSDLDTATSSTGQFAAFLVFLSGTVGCVMGGQLADRIGRERFVNLAMWISGACCLLSGVVFQIGFWPCALVAVVWGFFIVADSAQFSAMVTEVCPRHAVGTALTLQTSIGFLITMPTIQLVQWLEPVCGWQWTYPVLALGPVCGIAMIRRLARLRANATG